MQLTPVADGVTLVTGTHTNWVLVTDGAAVTVIDGGYPGDASAVVASIERIGRRPRDGVAMLLTHAHVDHLGAAHVLHDGYGIPVLTHPDEVAHAHREHLQQLSRARLAREVWRPSAARWTLDIVRAGATRDVAAPFATGFTLGGPLDLPGAPVPVPTPGHTDGHCAFLLTSAGALVTGDALVTGHPLSGVDGPQLLPAMFDHDRARALESLALLPDADAILPGHGPLLRMPVRDAVDLARERA